MSRWPLATGMQRWPDGHSPFGALDAVGLGHVSATFADERAISGARPKNQKMRQIMARLLRKLRQLVPSQVTGGTDFPFNRIAQARNHDQTLAAFKAEQMRVARRNRMTPAAVSETGN